MDVDEDVTGAHRVTYLGASGFATLTVGQD